MHGGDIYRNKVKLDFSVNTNPFGIPEGVKQTILQAMHTLEQYPDPSYERLKQALSKTYHTEHIVCGNGASELIVAICRLYKNVLLTAPNFSGYERAIQGNVLYFFKKDLILDIDAYCTFIIKSSIDLCILTNPNNPDGSILTRKNIEKVLQVCLKRNIMVLIDECFMELCDQDESCIPLLKKYSNLIVLSAFTKSMAIPGIRIGFCFCANQKIADLIESQCSEWNVSTIAQEAGIACTKEQEFLVKSRAFIKLEREYVFSSLQRLGIKVYPSSTNFLFFYTDIDVYNECLKRNILIRDCSDYKGLTKGFYRIAIKSHSENERLIQILEEVIHAQH